MKKVDILFLYESKVRELENICLLKYELERRGYSVAVLNTWNELGRKKHKYDAKVVVTHAMYHDGIYQFVQSIVGKVPKVVNMQCEQVGTILDDKIDDSRFVLRGIASQCMNICWGDCTVRRLKNKSGIDSAHLSLTGQITLDFCRGEFRSYFLSKEEILEKYKLPKASALNLFISSFAYVNLPQDLMEQSEIKDKDHFVRISNESFDGIMLWFEQFLSEQKDQSIIYRPHPAENGNSKLISLQNKYPDRFFVISDLSVKQWISISDRVYTWYSTSAAEVHAFGVPCAILRPVEIPHNMEVSLFENASVISTYKEFAETVQNGFSSSIDPNVFSDLYFCDSVPAYIKISDTIEKVLGDPSYFIKNPPSAKTKTLYQNIKQALWNIVSFFASCLPKTSGFLQKFRKQPVHLDEYTIARQRSNFASVEEIGEIQAKIGEVLKNQ